MIWKLILFHSFYSSLNTDVAYVGIFGRNCLGMCYSIEERTKRTPRAFSGFLTGMFRYIYQGNLVTESKSTEWTDEKHSLYLKSMEASFVNKLYDSSELLGFCRLSDPTNSRKKHFTARSPSGQVPTYLFSLMWILLRAGLFKVCVFSLSWTALLNLFSFFFSSLKFFEVAAGRRFILKELLISSSWKKRGLVVFWQILGYGTLDMHAHLKLEHLQMSIIMQHAQVKRWILLGIILFHVDQRLVIWSRLMHAIMIWLGATQVNLARCWCSLYFVGMNGLRICMQFFS